MAPSKWADACEVDLAGQGGEHLSARARAVSGLSVKPELLERAVSLHLAGKSEDKARGSVTAKASRVTMPSIATRTTERSFTAKPTGETEDRLDSRVTSKSTKKSIKDCVCFKHPSMLRGTSAAGVLRSFARIFKNSEGSALTYDLSSPVERLDFFISHNWSTRRLDKFFVLSTLFNLRAAILASVVCALLTIPLTVYGFLPMLEFVEERPDKLVYMESVSATFTGCAGGLLTFVFAHELASLMGWKGPVGFLDKTCIHQTDSALKREGIESLAAFLENSDSMILIYSKTYLKKLWTVYELASMLLLHPERKIVVMPSVFPKAMICGFFLTINLVTAKRLMWLRPVAEAFEKITGLKDAITVFSALFCVALALLFLQVLANWGRERAEITKVVQGFSIKDAMCFDEADRLVVQENIVSFMRDLSLVERSDADEDEASFQRRALDAFDDLVRKEVPPALVASLGRQNISYEQAVFMFIAQGLRGLELVAPCILGLVPVRKLMLRLAQDLTMSLSLQPCIVACLIRTALLNPAAPSKKLGCCTQRILGEFMFVFVTSYSSWFALEYTRFYAGVYDTWLAVFVVVVIVCVMPVFYIYRPVQANKVSRERLSDAMAGL